MLNRYTVYREKIGDFLKRLKKTIVRPNEADIADEVLFAQKEFYTKMHQPTLEISPAVSKTLPNSDDYVLMLTEIQDDINFLRTTAEKFADYIQEDYNFHSSRLLGLKDKIKELGFQLNQDNYVIAGSSNKIKENFQSPMSFTASVLPMAQIMPYGATLAESRRDDKISESKVRVLPGDIISDAYFLGTYSNGFPGNMHEYQGNNFVGYNDAHADYGSVIDGNSNTWFEYEAIKIPEEQSPQYGLYFSITDTKRVRWERYPDGGRLLLTLEVVFNEPITISQFNINLYVPPKSRPPYLQQVRISPDGVISPVTVSGYGSYKDAQTINYLFMPQECKVAQFFFVQPFNYQTEVGCLQYELDGINPYLDNLGFFAKNKVTEDVILSVENLGLEISESGQVTYPYKDIEDTISLQGILGDIISQSSVEIAPAMRWVIGIRDIEALNVEYMSDCELISSWYTFSSPPSNLVLTVDDYIPKDTSIDYFISADDVVWAPITPYGRGDNSIFNIIVQPTQSDSSVVGDNSLIIRNTTDKFKMKAVLHNNSSEATPIVRSFELIPISGGAFI